MVFSLRESESPRLVNEIFSQVAQGYMLENALFGIDSLLAEDVYKRQVLSGGVDPNKPLPSTGFSMLYVAATMPGDHAEVVPVSYTHLMARDEAARGACPEVDFVAGVPDSGIPHAIGYSTESKMPFGRPFIKYTPTWPRSFMPANQDLRNKIANMKQVPVPELIRDKKLLFVDDSIVRGTQLRETVNFLYDSGAAEVHMRSACPPIMYSCKYLSFSSSKSDMDLIARRVVDSLEGEEGLAHLAEYADADTERGQCLLKTICEDMGFDSLSYQSLQGMIEAIGIDPEKICTYCWDGRE